MSCADLIKASIAISALSLGMTGCGGVARAPHARNASVSSFPTVSVSGYLAAAEDDEDELGGLLTATPTPQVVTVDRDREWRLGVRAGAMLTAASEKEWDSGMSFGAFFRGPPSGGVAYELGVDYTSVSSAEGETSSGLYFARGDLLFGGWGRDGGSTAYLAAGGQYIRETAQRDGADATEERTGGSVHVGVGVGSVTGRWDLRALYSVVIGSDNAAGYGMVMTGFAF